MGKEGFYYNIDQAEKRKDFKRLAEIARVLVKCIPNQKIPAFEVLISDQPERVYFSGTREECMAYAEGYSQAPQNDQSCFDKSVMCICLPFNGKDNRVFKVVVNPENLTGVLIEDVEKRIADEQNKVEDDEDGDDCQPDHDTFKPINGW